MNESNGQKNLEARILIVDDGDTYRNLIRQILEQQGYKSIDEVSTQKEALSMLNAGSYDVAIIDIALKGNDEGIELLREINKGGIKTEAIITSGYVDTENQRKAFIEGARDVIQKDSGFKESLLAVVPKAVEQKQDFDSYCKSLGERLKIDDLAGKALYEQQYSVRLGEEISRQEALRRVLMDKILIINDSDEEKADLENRLRKEFNVISTKNPSDAKILIPQRVNLVLMDLLLAKTHNPDDEMGIALTKELTMVFPRLPILLTYYGDELNTPFCRKRALEAEADDLISVTGNIEQKIKEILGKARKSKDYRLLASVEDKRKQNDLRRILEDAGYHATIVNTLDDALKEINYNARPFDVFLVEYDSPAFVEQQGHKYKQVFKEKLSAVREVFGKKDLALLVVRSRENEKEDSEISSMEIGVRHILTRELVGQRDYTLPFVQSVLKEMEEERIWGDERINYEEDKVLADSLFLAKNPNDNNLLLRIKNRLELITAKAPNSDFSREQRFKVYCHVLDQDGAELIGSLEDITEKVISTQRILISRDPTIGKAVVFKQYSDPARIKLEKAASAFIKEHNRKVNESRDRKKKKESLPGLIYAANLPVINSISVILAHSSPEYGHLLTEMIKGPRLTSLVREMNYEIEKKNQEAVEFRKRFIFETNRCLAFFQTHPIPLPEDTESTHVHFGNDLQKTLKENLIFLTADFSELELGCLGYCIDLLYKDVNNSDTQYFDFNWSNLILRTGSEESTFADVMERRKDENTKVKQYVREKLHKIDWCKIDRKTNPLEDRRHESSQIRFTQQEREFYDFHFLCCKKKYEVLKSLMGSDSSNTPSGLRRIEEVIANLENSEEQALDRRSLINNPFTLQLFQELKEYESEDALISTYRHMRWFDHTMHKYLVRAIQRKQEWLRRLENCLTKEGKARFEQEKSKAKDDAVAVQRIVKKYVSKYQKRNFIRTRRTFSYRIRSDELFKFIKSRSDDQESYAHQFIDAVNSYMDAVQEQKERFADLRYYVEESRRMIKKQVQVLGHQLYKTPNKEHQDIADLGNHLFLDFSPENTQAYFEKLKSLQDAKAAKFGAALYVQLIMERLSNFQVDYKKLIPGK
jgi:CheY-like chemotaxis protein